MTRSHAARRTSTTAGSGNDDVVNLEESSVAESNENNRMRRHKEVDNTLVDEEGDISRQTTILEPLERNTINAKKFLQLPEIQLTELAKDSSIANRKGHLNLQFSRVISN